ncbi:ABC transporter ATP-binding protein [Oceanobacillus salinisoli]|uniref:ABC transporter ATP-binding protein n=1 Tax=Oceanobacillus salinisoli TaxID=2678611 RepID=UPI0012E1FA0B|nr:ABC transporter ATP-binding protein [Oceanobacillus salinisoli]
MSYLMLDGVTYSYEDKKQIVQGITWKINKGEFHSLVGRSGCGKTTLLKIAAGLLQPDEGAVYLGNEKIVKPSLEIGYVFQAPTLLEWKSVMDNVLLPVSLKRKPTKEDCERASALLASMRLGDYQYHYPTELSGGQQSRVAIARALITNPSLLFLDEPFAALDALTREELQDDLLTLCQKNRMTVLFITHDISEAIYLSDRVAVMEEGNMIYDLEVNLPKPRTGEIKYGDSFNQLCLQVRHEMNGGRV